MDIIEHIRRACVRYETTMAYAFRRAVGIEVVWAEAPSEPVTPEVAEEVMRCFRNHGSPMDGRRG